MRIKVHTSVIGNAGYNVHAREFLTALNKLTPLKIRNFSVGQTWEGISDTPHDDEPYITDDLKSMLSEQTTLTDENEPQEWSIYSYDKNFKQDINIVLVSESHHYFSQNYLGYNIAYCVTESTKLEKTFKKTLQKFHQIWVATNWQKQCYISQGLEESKIKVVNEGVNSELFKPSTKSVFDPIITFFDPVEIAEPELLPKKVLLLPVAILPESFPIKIFDEPVDKVNPESLPRAILLFPVVTVLKLVAPIAILSSPSVNANKALLPTPTLLCPIVNLSRTPFPKAVLSPPVVTLCILSCPKPQLLDPVTLAMFPPPILYELVVDGVELG